MAQIPKDQIHHLKESLEEDSGRRKIPWLLLVGFILLTVAGALIHIYYYRDLPKCQDESVQILLNKNIRSNEALIKNARTQAFDRIREVSHDNSRRSCVASLITNEGNYSLAYLVVNDLVEKNWLSRFVGDIQYSVVIEKIESN
ncbi:hypothetical protein [Polynucleobacter sp. MWH-UH23A]|jgi:hypothetical protein|uniref:hypothetical protein n=1 Tax=Polynucleobacter sp. MWH-UH23A TaxID=1855613 RepID=UPI003364B973